MTSDTNQNALMIEDIYHRSYSDLSQLQQQLPKDTVAELAREVITRLQRQVIKPRTDDQSIFLLTKALVSKDAKAAAAHVEHQYKSGIGVNALYLELLSPAAALLGTWWEKDEITFAEVTVATGRIYSIMRSLTHHIRPENPPEIHAAFFASAPGDDHILGLKMAVDLARKQGWEIQTSLDTDHDGLIEEITASGLLLIGLSAGGEHSLPSLAKLILALRVSIPDAKILVSGAAVETHADKIALMHPDASARTFEEAMEALQDLWQSFHMD